MSPEALAVVAWPQCQNKARNEMAWLYNLNYPQWAAW